MQASSSDPFFDDWQAFVDDPVREWSRVAKVAGARAQSLVDDYPVATALVRTKLKLTIGPRGLRLNSQFNTNPEARASAKDIATRKSINRIIKNAGRLIDAGAVLMSTEFFKQIDWSATVYGDGFAIRAWQDDRVPATRWRIIHPMRVRNPKGQGNSERMQDGIEFDGYGRRVAIWVDKSRYSSSGMFTLGSEPVRIPWYEPDGTPNAVHHVFYRRPGSVRGLTGFAPLILPARLLQMVDVSFVAGKRVQMSHPMLLEVPDLKAAREQYRGTRFENLLLGPGTKATLNTAKFEGADYTAFVDTQVRGLSAAWGIPYELVLGDHSSKSGAAARSLWQQAAEESEGFQNFFADNAQRPIDESFLREAYARGTITGLTDDWCANMEGDYQGPPPINPDPLKEAQACDQWLKNGMSKTTAFAMSGYNYDDERELKAEEDELDASTDGKDAELAVKADAAFVDRVAAAAAAVEKSGVEDLTWPIVIAADGAETAPGAFLSALAKQNDTAPTTPTPPPADPTQPGGEQQRAASLTGTTLDPLIKPAAMASLRDDFLAGARLIVEGMPKPQSPQITANVHLPAGLVSGSTINVAAPDPTPVQVNVAAPNPTPVTVQVAAAEPAAPAPIQVNVAAPAVTVENTVEVPSRTVKATPQADGSVLMVPQE